MQSPVLNVYRLRNAWIEVAFLNYGATLIEFIDQETKTNIVLRYKNLDDYIKNPYYMGSIVGRYAGRIQDAKYDNQSLDANFLGKHHLHGGFEGFSHQFFEVETKDESLTFTYLSQHLSGGFFHDVEVKIHVWLEKNTLCYHMHAIPKGKTLISLTVHPYFNLSGLSSDIMDHELRISANHFVALNPEFIPVEVTSIEQSPLDFRQMKPVRNALNMSDLQLHIAKGIDHPFILTHESPAVELKNTERMLTVTTDQPCVVIYTGNYLSDAFDSQFYAHSGICIECQGVPNHMNLEGYEDENTYDPQHHYHQTTRFTLTRLK